jgi:hypothetical protein
LDYLHTSSCPITCASVPGLICAAEHYDLPELLQACFHHTKQFLRLDVVSKKQSTVAKNDCGDGGDDYDSNNNNNNSNNNNNNNNNNSNSNF